MRILKTGGKVLASGVRPGCGVTTQLAVVHHAVHPSTRNTFHVSCTLCGGGAVVEAEQIGDVFRAVSVYPKLRRRFQHMAAIPAPLNRALREVYAALSEEAWTLTGLGCRLVVERMAALHGIPKGSLKERLEELGARFPSLRATVEDADLVRLVGNMAAHDSDTDFGQMEAETAVEFVEEVLRDVYVWPEKRQRLKDKLENR